MKQIYTARDDMDAHFLQGLLQEANIQSVIQGEPLEGAWGNLPLSDTARPGVWVNEADVPRATPIIDEYVQREMKHANEPDDSDEKVVATWKCPKCGEEVDADFEVCWNCGTERPQTTQAGGSK